MTILFCLFVLFLGMNAAVRAVVRMGLYVGAKVYFIREVRPRSYLFHVFIYRTVVYLSCTNTVNADAGYLQENF